jgi:hypothetical protein
MYYRSYLVLLKSNSLLLKQGQVLPLNRNNLNLLLLLLNLVWSNTKNHWLSTESTVILKISFSVCRLTLMLLKWVTVMLLSFWLCNSGAMQWHGGGLFALPTMVWTLFLQHSASKTCWMRSAQSFLTWIASCHCATNCLTFVKHPRYKPTLHCFAQQWSTWVLPKLLWRPQNTYFCMV